MADDRAPTDEAAQTSLLPPPEPPPADEAPRRPRKGKGSRRPRTEAQRAAASATAKALNAKRAGRTMTPAKLRDALAEAIRSLAGGLTLAGVVASPRLMYDGEIIAARAEELAVELVALAEKNPSLYRALTSMVAASSWAKIGSLALGIAVPVAANHGLLPVEIVSLVGAPPPPPRPEKAPASSDGG